MAIGVQNSAGTDFDSLFEPRTTSKISNVGVQASNGTDISNLYERLSSGSAVSSNTGVQNSSGTDCRSLFAAKGSVVYWDGTLDDVPTSHSENRSDGGRALAELVLFSDGRVATRNSSSEQQRGRWDGSVADSGNTQVRYNVTSQTGAGTVSNSASSWSALSSSRGVSIETIGSGAFGSIQVQVGLRLSGDSSTEIFTTITLQTNSGF